MTEGFSCFFKIICLYYEFFRDEEIIEEFIKRSKNPINFVVCNG